MNGVKANIDRVAALMGEVKTHCMCAKFEELSSHYRVIYPRGFYPYGAQAHKGGGKANALKNLLMAMERHWQSNGINGSRK